MKNITQTSTVRELLDYLKQQENDAGCAYILSEGYDACDEANKMIMLQTEIHNIMYTEQCFCKSYSNDSREIVDCTCGKCEIGMKTMSFIEAIEYLNENEDKKICRGGHDIYWYNDELIYDVEGGYESYRATKEDILATDWVVCK